MRAFVIDDASGRIANTVEVIGLDGSYDPGAGYSLIAAVDEYDIGDAYDAVTGFQKAVKPAVVPAEITPYQARVALTHAGLRDVVEGAISKSSRDVRDAWEFGLVVYRDSQMIKALGAALGLSSAQIDDLFVAASQIS